MSDLTTLSQIGLTMLAIVVPVVVLVRLVAGRATSDPSAPDLRSVRWPRGIQEEDPLPWRFVRPAM